MRTGPAGQEATASHERQSSVSHCQTIPLVRASIGYVSTMAEYGLNEAVDLLPGQLHGAWAGESSTFADTEERRVLFAALDSFRTAHLNVTHRRRQDFYALRSIDWRLLSSPPFNFLSTLDQVDTAIDANADIAQEILKTGLKSFGLENDPSDDSLDWCDQATEADLDKARTTIRQLYRDWSAEGAEERRASYAPVLRDIAYAFADVPDKRDVRVLVPGAGLGRLVFELCNWGFDVEGNEISYHQLIASSWVLNQTEKAEQYNLYPFAFDFSNIVSRADQLKIVKIPDVHPATALAKSTTSSSKSPFDRMNMTAADFPELYSTKKYKEHFDAIVTVFFLDTAPNIIQYIQTVHNCLKPGGIWANHGPLLWHWVDRQPPDRHHDREPPGRLNLGRVELSVEEVLLLVSSMGFEVNDKGIRHEGAGYIQNPSSLLRNEYRTSHWVARKIA
ncbi:MAG: hypothetical protein Q9219_005272 [cf. Caloplaca sp. 3 TL-2023]